MPFYSPIIMFSIFNNLKFLSISICFILMCSYVNAQSGATITSQPKSQAVCEGTAITLSITATGPGTIFYRWQLFDAVKGVYGDIPTTNPNYTGITTSNLSFSTTGNFGAGIYRCRTTIDYDVFSNGATITINSIPSTAKVGSSTAACSGSSVVLNASGGTAGQYRWYTMASGGTAIAGQTNSAYTTPVLTTTTTYYVSINNGTCESARTPVTAMINTPPTAPTSAGVARCGTGTVTLTAAGGAAGQYRWYTAPTGGTAITGETNSTYTTPALTSTTTYYVSINNGTCESTRAAVIATILSTGCNTIPPTISPVPLTTLVAGKITLDLVPLIVAPGVLDVKSITIVTQPTSGATASISNGILTIDYGGKVFSGNEFITIRACDVAGLCSQPQTFTIEVAGDIIVYNAISPNNDKRNEILYIKYIDVIPGMQKNKVSIYNRWGSKVFEKENYNNTTAVFKGLSDNGDELPSGTYFYKIAFEKLESRTGYLAIKR
jgi:gliding motility-associated-like protein